MGHNAIISRVRVLLLPLLAFSLYEFFALHTLPWFLQSPNRDVPYLALTINSVVGLIGSYSLFISISRLLKKHKGKQLNKNLNNLNLIQLLVFTLGIAGLLYEGFSCIKTGNYYHINGLLSKVIPFLSLLNNTITSIFSLKNLYRHESLNENELST